MLTQHKEVESMRKIIFLLFCSFLLLIFQNNLISESEDYEIIRITNNNSYDAFPDIDEDWLIWKGNGLNLYNYKTGEFRKIVDWLHFYELNDGFISYVDNDVVIHVQGLIATRLSIYIKISADT